jgi:hypothetical protein
VSLNGTLNFQRRTVIQELTDSKRRNELLKTRARPTESRVHGMHGCSSQQPPTHTSLPRFARSLSGTYASRAGVLARGCRVAGRARRPLRCQAVTISKKGPPETASLSSALAMALCSVLGAACSQIDYDKLEEEWMEDEEADGGALQ